MTSLQYFYENAPEYHIIATRNLLKSAINEKIDIKTLYPMDMEEFMLALDEGKLVELIKESFTKNISLPSTLHDVAMKLYRQYLVVGGMPECVMQFIQTKDYILVRHIQDTILASYLNHLNKVEKRIKNKKVLEWLCLSGIVSQVYKIDHVKKPLENYKNIDDFKIYVSDLGLLCAKKDLVANDILYMVDEINDFKGGMVENYVNTQLLSNGYQTYYWESKRGAEIDFVIQREGKLIPLEVKSADNTKSKSLNIYIETYQPAYAIKLSTKNFAFENNKKIVPLYAAFCI